jgi:hypothetical protein
LVLFGALDVFFWRRFGLMRHPVDDPRLASFADENQWLVGVRTEIVPKGKDSLSLQASFARE